MSAHAEPSSTNTELDRAWWLRVPAVLIAPSAVFAALRDDSDAAGHARQEPVAAVVGLAGVAAFLLTRTAREILDDSGASNIVIPVWAFFAGSVYGLVLYWLLGAALYAGSTRLGSRGTYRRARHVLGYAAVPIALSLVTIWPIRITIYGSDLFRTGGDDFGTGDKVFGAIALAFMVWSAILLVIGVREVHGWSWFRALGAVALAAVFPTLLSLTRLL